MSEEEEDESSIKSRLNKRQALEATNNNPINKFAFHKDPRFLVLLFWFSLFNTILIGKVGTPQCERQCQSRGPNNGGLLLLPAL